MKATKRSATLAIACALTGTCNAALAGSQSVLDPYAFIKTPSAPTPTTTQGRSRSHNGVSPLAEPEATTTSQFVKMPGSDQTSEPKSEKVAKVKPEKEPKLKPVKVAKQPKSKAAKEKIAKVEKSEPKTQPVKTESPKSVVAGGNPDKASGKVSGIVDGTKTASDSVVKGAKAAGGGLANGTKKMGEGIASGAKASGSMFKKGLKAATSSIPGFKHGDKTAAPSIASKAIVPAKNGPEVISNGKAADTRQLADAKQAADTRQLADAKQAADTRQLADAKQVADTKQLADAKPLADSKSTSVKPAVAAKLPELKREKIKNSLASNELKVEHVKKKDQIGELKREKVKHDEDRLITDEPSLLGKTFGKLKFWGHKSDIASQQRGSSRGSSM